ncbi:hypothetical protein B7494_g5086 [Chlorociboria aeruginascens]|nr:hypothetical protein B7494_g5086 [Chlorociboria aeruginascens]
MTAADSSTQEIRWFQCNEDFSMRQMAFKTVDPNSTLVVYRQQPTKSNGRELWVYLRGHGLQPYGRVLLESKTPENKSLYNPVNQNKVTNDDFAFYEYKHRIEQADKDSGESVAREQRKQEVRKQRIENEYAKISKMREQVKKS